MWKKVGDTQQKSASTQGTRDFLRWSNIKINTISESIFNKEKALDKKKNKTYHNYLLKKRNKKICMRYQKS